MLFRSVEVIQGELKNAYERFQFAESIQDDVMKLQQLTAQEDQWRQYMRDNIDTLTHADIERIRMGIDDARQERDKLSTELNQKQQEFQQAQQQSHQELLKKGTEVLRERIKGWNEDTAKQVREYAISSGFTEDEIAGVVDPRQVETLWKAAQYDALKANAKPAVKKVQAAPQIKPKSRNPMPDSKKKELNLRKKLKSNNLSANEKANLIGDDIASRFFR